MPVTVHGIPNCDTVKKARTWLDGHGIAYTFHDYKKQGVPLPQLDGWIRQLGWERLLNRKGTAWRQLDAAVRAGVADAAGARRVMLAQPSVIKRPVAEWPDGSVTVGFDPQDWARRAGR